MAKKLTTDSFHKLLREVAASVEDEGLGISERREIPYGIQLVITGGGMISLYNGKAGPSAVLGGRFTSEEKAKLERMLSTRGLLRGGTTAVEPTAMSAGIDFASQGPASSAEASVSASPQNLAGHSGVRIGTDESGKGDYFGPLVVAGVKIHHSMEAKLLAAGIQDSKRISGHTTAMALGGWIESELPCAIRVLMPEEYNKSYGGNLNVLLARLHAQVIAELAEDNDAGIAIVDQFANGVVLQREVRALGCGIRVMARHRAESDVAVGAASIVARGRYLAGLRQLSNEWTIKLAPGAGDPVLKAGAEFVRLFGAESLSKVGKLHFKTTGQILSRAGNRG